MSIDISVDLRGKFAAARNQGRRPTCMAFAASDTHSFAHATTNYFSTEFAHYSAVKRRTPLDPKRGVPMPLMIDSIRDDGQPPEEVWPYLTDVPSPLSSWQPPTPCAPLFRHAIRTQATDLSSIFSALDAGYWNVGVENGGPRESWHFRALVDVVSLIRRSTMFAGSRSLSGRSAN